MDGDAFERFLEEALARGALTAREAADCRRIGSTLDEVGVDLSAADVARRKGYLDAAAAGEIERALAQRRIGKYEVLERLGAGSAGVVWRARDEKLGRIVALKLLARHREGLSRYHERFLREARIAVTLNDVHIVRGLDYGEADGYCFFAMEFVAGENASERLEREGRIDEKEALRIARDVVLALVHVQRFDLVHRDIKPSNLLITPSGAVKVCDFGLAKPSLEEAARMGGDGTTAGTPRYMSPEQIKDPTRLDWRSDCYSLGATLYHLLTGSPPFGAGDGGSIIHKHVTEPARDPRELVPDLSQGAAAVVLKMLQKEPADRYGSLADLRDDLESVIDGRPPVHTVTFAPRERPMIEALSERSAHRPSSGRRRHALLTGAVLVAGTLAWVGFKVGNPPPAASAPPAPPAPAEEGPASPPAPPPPTVEPEDIDSYSREPGAPALALAQREEAAGADLLDLVTRYEWIAEQFEGTAAGQTAKTRAQELRVRLGAEAEAALARLRHESRSLETRGRFGAAIALFDTFPSRFSATLAADAAGAEVKRLRAEGGERVADLLELARRETAARNFGDAEQFVAEAEAAGIVSTQAAVAAARAGLAEASEQHAARRAAELAGYRAAYGGALRAAAATGAAAAREFVDAELARGALTTYAAEIAELRGDIDAVERVKRALTLAWDRLAALRGTGEAAADRLGLRGTPVAVVDGRLEVELASGTRLEVDPGDLDLAQLRALLGSALEPEDVADEEALFLFVLASGNFEAAREQITVLGHLAGDDPVLADQAEQGARGAWQRVYDAATAETDEAIRAARLARSQGRTVDARRHLDRALRTLSSYAPAHIELGLLRMDLGALDDAERSFRTALELDGAPRETRLRLAQVLARRERFSDAEDELRAYLAEPEREADLEDEARALLAHVVEERRAVRLRAHWKDARAALRARNLASAEQALTAILELDPTEKDALFEIGRLYAGSGRAFLGYRALTLFLREYPEDRRVRDALKERARLERFRVSKPEARARLVDARAALAEDRADYAIDLLRRALAASPFLTEARFRLGEALLARGSRTGSRDDVVAGHAELDDVVLLHPEHWGALRELARARLALGRPEEALAAASRAMEADTNDADAAVLAGRAQFALRELQSALELFGEAARRDPLAGEPVMRQAIVHERLGHRAQARELVDRVYSENLRVRDDAVEELSELYRRLQD